MKHPDPRIATARRLAALADELESGASFPVTRLTVLKRVCADASAAALFGRYLAELAQSQFRTAPPARLDAERKAVFQSRIDTAVGCIQAYMADPSREADLALRAARRALESAQNEVRDTRWASVRTIHSRDALVVENAIHCILDVRNSAEQGYRLGRAWAERYDPRHPGGLVPGSAPRVREIAAFWLQAPLPLSAAG